MNVGNFISVTYTQSVTSTVLKVLKRAIYCNTRIKNTTYFLMSVKGLMGRRKLTYENRKIG